MAYRRLLLLRSPARCPKICYPPSYNRAEVPALRLSLNISTNIGLRSFGTFAKAKKFVQQNPWFSRIFRVFRMSSLLFGIGGAAYTYGQVKLLEDPIWHQENTLRQVLSSLGARFCVRFLDNEDLSNDKVGVQFCVEETCSM